MKYFKNTKEQVITVEDAVFTEPLIILDIKGTKGLLYTQKQVALIASDIDQFKNSGEESKVICKLCRLPPNLLSWSLILLMSLKEFQV